MKYATEKDGEREGALSHMAAASKADHSSLGFIKLVQLWWCYTVGEGNRDIIFIGV